MRQQRLVKQSAILSAEALLASVYAGTVQTACSEMATALICVAAVGQSTGSHSLEPRYNLPKGKLNHGRDTAAAEHLQGGTSPGRANSDARDTRAAHVWCPPPAATSGTSAACGRSAELLLQVLPLKSEQIETPQLHQAKWWWRASVFSVDGVRFVGNGNHRVCAALLLRVCQPGPKPERGLAKLAPQRSKSRGYG